MSSVKILSLFVILSFLSFDIAQAQTFQIVNGDTINKKDVNRKRQGKWIVTNKTKKLPGYTPDQKVEEGNYKNSRKTGLWIAYFSNGNKKNEINYKNGRASGSYKTYFSNGVAQEEGTWKGNRNVGTFKRFMKTENQVKNLTLVQKEKETATKSTFMKMVR